MFCKSYIKTISREKVVGSLEVQEGDCKYKKLYRRVMPERKSEDISDILLFLLKETMDQKPRLSSKPMRNTWPLSILDKGHISFTLRTIRIPHIIPTEKSPTL